MHLSVNLDGPVPCRARERPPCLNRTASR